MKTDFNFVFFVTGVERIATRPDLRLRSDQVAPLCGAGEIGPVSNRTVRLETGPTFSDNMLLTTNMFVLPFGEGPMGGY